MQSWAAGVSRARGSLKFVPAQLHCSSEIKKEKRKEGKEEGDWKKERERLPKMIF